MKLSNLLSRIDRDYFYLMHLSYGDDKSSRAPLWKFATNRNLVGLSHKLVRKKWEDVSEGTKSRLKGWRYQLELFCEEMIEGDCVVVLDGITHLLGVGLIQSPCKLRSELEGDDPNENFFRYVRSVRWLLKYAYEERIRFKIPPTFNNTIRQVDKDSVYWRIAHRELDLESPSKQIQSRAKDARRKAADTVYHEGGVREVISEIIIRDPRLIREARRRYGAKCKACKFDFEKKYGKQGHDFIEVHHKKPLSERKSKTQTRIKDVCVVCSNCHRMIHRTHPPISLAKLKSIMRRT